METASSAYAPREAWLRTLGEKLAPVIEAKAKAAGVEASMKPWRVSCGWPSKGGLPGNKRRVRGQCWDHSASGDGHAEIYISPVEAKAEEACDIMAHELIHALLGTAVGHKAPFGKVCKAIGLEGKVTATTGGPDFWAWAKPLLEECGPYPHAAITPGFKAKVAKTYLLKAECPECGYTVRLTKKWADMAVPACPCCSTHDKRRTVRLELDGAEGEGEDE